jgi:hypothetical protein
LSRVGIHIQSWNQIRRDPVLSPWGLLDPDPGVKITVLFKKKSMKTLKKVKFFNLFSSCRKNDKLNDALKYLFQNATVLNWGSGARPESRIRNRIRI